MRIRRRGRWVVVWTCAAAAGALLAFGPSLGARAAQPDGAGPETKPHEEAWFFKTQAILFGETITPGNRSSGEPGASVGVREGGETCADALVITSLPFNDTGDTRDNQNNYESPNCNDDVNQSNDVVYVYSPPVSQIIQISMCDTDTTAAGGHIDTRLWVYESMTGDPNDCNPANEIICNDDDPNQCLPQVTAPRTARIGAMEVVAGRTYYIIVDGWNGENGIYAINVREVEPGVCCTNAGGPNTCEEDVSALECRCLTAKFTEGAAATCAVPDCYADPTPAAGSCPETHVFGPGFNTGAVSFFVISSDDTFGTSHAEAYWDTAEPLRFHTFSGVYSLTPGLGGACDKPDNFTITFYANDCDTPGEIIAGPFSGLPVLRDGTGFAFAGTSQIYDFTVQLPVTVSFTTAWVGVAAAADPNNPDCIFRTMAYGDEGAATGQTGDLLSVILGPGAPFPFSVGGDMAMCVSGPINPGACCDDQTGTCTDNVQPADCPPPSRFGEDTLCSALDPPCGMGACCGLDGNCQITTLAECTNSSVPWKGGVSCAFANCPPFNDDCALVTPAVGGPPYTFANRTNGATDDDCPALGVPSGWEAFTLSECSDIVLDYCGTFPAFAGNAANFLLEQCCGLPASKFAAASSTTARVGTCCLDEPPGYDPNVAIAFHGVAAGTWYYPVFSGGGSLGDYSLNVTGGPGSPDHHGDTNANGRVDLQDYAVFNGCLSGPGAAFGSGACACLVDHDADGDVDLADYWRFQQQRTACASCSGTAEGEPGCSGVNDTCATATTISCGATVCGTSSTDDVDHYKVAVASTSNLTWTVTAEFPASVSIRDISLGCPGAVLATVQASACEPATVSACVRAGTYALTVAPQAGQSVPCGSAYRANLTCAAGCTPPATGACCRANASCTANVPQATCEAAEGKYQGDGSTCPCPAPPPGDECLTAINLGSGNVSGSVTFNRSQITSNASDPVSACESNAGGPFSKDGSIWFKWNSGGAVPIPRLHLDLCCQGGGAAADTLITWFPARALNEDPGIACPAIIGAGNGQELACNDDGCGDGGGAALCLESGGTPSLTANRTYYILVEVFDSGLADELQTFTLTYRSDNCTLRTCPICATPVACPGGSIAENEQSQANYCGLDYVDNYNSGCNPLTRVPPEPEAFAAEIACGDTVCGSSGYYNTTGGDPLDRRRDTDWYLLFLTEETTVNWEVESQTEGVHALLINVDDCSNVIIIDSAADLNAAGQDPAPGCGAVNISSTVPAGRYAVFASFIDPATGATNEAIDCPKSYVGRLTCQRGDVLATPADACGSAPTLTGGGRYTGLIGAPAVQTPDGESTCDGALGDEGFCDGPAVKDIYWNYMAPCTGKVSFEIRRGPAPMVLSAHSACPANCATELPGGLGLSCSDFGGGVGGVLPKITLDVEAGTNYVIRLAADADGPYELVISDCIVECAARCGDGELDDGEECDDGNLVSGDGCDAFCQLE